MFGRTKRPKRPVSKAGRIVRRILRIAGTIVLVLLLIAAVVAGPTGYRYLYQNLDTGHKTVDTSMSKDRKLKDLDYMYDLVCLQNPRKELFEKAYGISYEDVYKKYRELTINSKSEYEFLSLMTCFLADLPGEHNIMKLPDYQRNSVNSSFPMGDVYGTQDIKDYQYSWMEDFRDDVEKYIKYKALTFTYVDGKYIGINPALASGNAVTDYVGGQIISLNGKDPKDMCFDFFERYHPTCDTGNNCFFRSTLIFNDGTGVKYTAKILMPDGEIVTADLYDDPAFDLAFIDAPKTYPELFKTPAEDTEQASSDEPQTYRITTDKERKLVYLNTISCDASEGERLATDLQNALDETDAENVILDLRSNGGGSTSFANKQLLPVLFGHDVDYHASYVGKLNDYTKGFRNIITRIAIAEKGKIDFKDGYFYYAEDFSVKGQAKRNYKIYVLTSQSTFSTADIIAALCKDYDNAILVGTNTGGEGISGAPINCVLPESRFGFVYVPTVNEKYPENAFKGIEPDIYVHMTTEEYYLSRELTAAGKKAGSYEMRQTWDKTLIEVLKLIDSE